jgi:hypothetical protein
VRRLSREHVPGVLGRAAGWKLGTTNPAKSTIVNFADPVKTRDLYDPLQRWIRTGRVSPAAFPRHPCPIILFDSGMPGGRSRLVLA